MSRKEPDADPQREADQIPGVLLPEQQTQLAGHSAILDELIADLTAQRLPGAILLHGPRGIGKATMTYAFIRRLLTETGDEPAERVAAQVANGSHPNLYTLRRTKSDGRSFSSFIRAPEARQIISALHQTPGRASYRVCVVDSIDDANNTAANALLKIVEEPPQRTLFVLISHRPGSLLPTIRSRCRAIAARPLADADLRDLLKGQGADDSMIDEAVALAGGRPRRAFEILALGNVATLKNLRQFLAEPTALSSSDRLALSDAIAGASDIEKQVAREQLYDWMAAECRSAAIHAPEARQRLASATDLWDKAHVTFAEADTYNLDARQTHVAVLDAIRHHYARFASNLAGTT